jgi:hypothetical protein
VRLTNAELIYKPNTMKKENKLEHIAHFSAIKKAGKNFETLYNFCGDFHKVLESDYVEQKLKDKGLTFPQYCVVVFANLIEPQTK